MKEVVMITLMARHQVDDWGKWFELYQAQRGQLAQMGVTREAALQSTTDRNDVVVIHEFDSMEAAEEFLKATEAPDMVQMLEAGGVRPETMTMELFHTH
jgi:hypothetical protein